MKIETTTTLPSTVAGASLGQFAIPATAGELIWQLANGVPCEIQRHSLDRMMKLIAQCFDNPDIKIEADDKIAQLTPIRAELNDHGKRMLA